MLHLYGDSCTLLFLDNRFEAVQLFPDLGQIVTADNVAQGFLEAVALHQDGKYPLGLLPDIQGAVRH